MSKYKFTPGPWKTEGITENKQSLEVRGINDWTVALIYPFNEGATQSEAHANANLIVQAPALVEVVEELIALLMDCGGFSEVVEAINKAQAVLAKVRRE